MASAHRKVRSGSEQAYLRAVEREEQAEAEGANPCGADSAEFKPSDPIQPEDDTTDMFRQHSHLQ